MRREYRLKVFGGDKRGVEGDHVELDHPLDRDRLEGCRLLSPRSGWFRIGIDGSVCLGRQNAKEA